MLSITHLL